MRLYIWSERLHVISNSVLAFTCASMLGNSGMYANAHPTPPPSPQMQAALRKLSCREGGVRVDMGKNSTFIRANTGSLTRHLKAKYSLHLGPRVSDTSSRDAVHVREREGI